MSSQASSRLGRLLAHHIAKEDQPTMEQGAFPISMEALKEVQKAFRQYAKVIERSTGLSANSQSMYVDHADYFVRWLAGGFTPGAAGSKPRRRAKK